MIYTGKQVDDELYVKIGRSHHPSERLKRLQTGNPDALELLAVLHGEYDDIKLEGEIHCHLKHHRVIGGGNEWYIRSDKVEAVLDFIANNRLTPESRPKLTALLQKKPHRG